MGQIGWRNTSHLPGVFRAIANLNTKLARVEYDPQQVSVEVIVNAANQAGYAIGEATTQLTIRDWVGRVIPT
jgi:hypothetical protein